MLTENQLKDIKEKAERLYPVQKKFYWFGEYDWHDINCRPRTAYIAAKTEDAIEIKVLREALEEIVDLTESCKEDYVIGRLRGIAQKSLIITANK